MIVTYKIPFRDGELRIGWASWDKGRYEHRSIKYAYKDSSGKISRGSPEIPLDMLVELIAAADEQNEIPQNLPKLELENVREVDLEKCSMDDLKQKNDILVSVLATIQGMMTKVNYPEWEKIYDRVASEREAVKQETERRRLLRP